MNCYNLTKYKDLSVLSEILHTQTTKQINKNWHIIYQETYDKVSFITIQITPLKVWSFQHGNFGWINFL